jgi:hypothetical protein
MTIKRCESGRAYRGNVALYILTSIWLCLSNNAVCADDLTKPIRVSHQMGSLFSGRETGLRNSSKIRITLR